MGFRFHKRIKILPGVSINLGKRGISTSIGPRGAKVTIGEKGVRTTLGLPGTGISYTKYRSYNHRPPGTGNGRGKDYIPVCPYCGHHMRKYWERCPACGRPLGKAEAPGPAPASLTCPRCGKVWEDTGNIRFCPACGAPLAGQAPAPSETAPATTEATPASLPVQQGTAPSTGRKWLWALAAAVVLILLIALV